MPKTKHARLWVQTVRMACPSCGEAQLGPNGSPFWTSDEVAQAVADGGRLTCSCGAPFRVRVPKAAC